MKYLTVNDAVSKNEVVNVHYQLGGETQIFRFYYAQGAVSEV